MLEHDLHDGVLTLTMNRPEVGNALSPDLVAALGAALGAARDDARVRVVVLTGAGKHFCAGADLQSMRAMEATGREANVADALRTQGIFAALAEFRAPVIARVNGAARGGGVGLVAAADVVVAVDTATFAFTEVRLGIIPAMISPFVLARLGEGRTRRLFLTAETFDAEQAAAFGLVDRVVPGDELDATIGLVCGQLRAGAPGALAEAKRLVRTVIETERDAVGQATAEWIARLRAGEEGQEGMAAFLAKRKPRWAP